VFYLDENITETNLLGPNKLDLSNLGRIHSKGLVMCAKKDPWG
jgi:hypothetical protein